MVIGSDIEIIKQILIAMFLGLIVGTERELHGKPAGMRTYTLLTAAACTFTILGFIIFEVFAANYEVGIFRADPTRIIHAIIVGVSFLGAGVILKGKERKVENLTTAAGVLIMTSVGIMVGLEKYLLAMFITSFVILINIVILSVEHKYFGTHLYEQFIMNDKHKKKVKKKDSKKK